MYIYLYIYTSVSIYLSISIYIYISIYVWRFPEMRVPPVIIHFERWDFPMEINQPASYWGTPMTSHPSSGDSLGSRRRSGMWSHPSRLRRNGRERNLDGKSYGKSCLSWKILWKITFLMEHPMENHVYHGKSYGKSYLSWKILWKIKSMFIVENPMENHV